MWSGKAQHLPWGLGFIMDLLLGGLAFARFHARILGFRVFPPTFEVSPSESDNRRQNSVYAAATHKTAHVLSSRMQAALSKKLESAL